MKLINTLLLGAVLLPSPLIANDLMADLAAQLSAVSKSAFEATSKQMAVKINLAGKQRMLTQKMTKEALLISLDIDAENNRKNLQDSAALFEQTLQGLKNGDDALGLTKTNDQQVLQQLDKVTTLWKAFKPAVESVVKGEKDNKSLQVLTEKNLPLLAEMNTAVSLYEEISGTDSMTEEFAQLATVINLSGKQRMLTQKMTKEQLLIALDIDKEKNTENLAKTIQLFENTLKGLKKGDDALNLPATTDEAILEQLEKVAELWQQFKPLLKKSGREEGNLQQIAELNPRLLQEMDKAVSMYEETVSK